MKRIRNIGLAVLAALALTAVLTIPASASSPTQGPSGLAGLTSPGGSHPKERDTLVPGHYIVVLKDSVDHPGAVAESQTERHNGRLGFVYRHALEGYSAKLSDAAVETLRRNPNVKYVSPVRKYEATAQTTPVGIKRIKANANPATDIDEIDDARVDADVAIIDTGIDYTHPDLNVAGRTNCVPPSESESEGSVEKCVDSAGTDGDGHGTHVAGTAGAIDNGSGVVGVAPGARLWAVRVLNNEGGGTDPWIIAGIDWVTAHASQIEVANMSLAGWGKSIPMEEAIDSAVSAGVVVVVAAGNADVNALNLAPANIPATITVSAMVDTDGNAGGKGSSCSGKDDTLAKVPFVWGSNWGSAVELAAPGACVLSTLPVGGSHYGANYGSLGGTSMAAPHVAGAAAVLAAKSNPGSKADVEAIRKQLIASGSLDWTDTSEDGDHEPLLYVGGTPISAPEVVTGGWQGTEIAAGTLTGALNARGLKAEYEFEYGLTTAYGETAPATPKEEEGSYMSVEADVNGLEPGRTYHYRLALTTSQGTVYGADRTFTSSQWESHAPLSGPSSEDEQLSGVSCPTQSWCMAVDWEHVTEGKAQLGSYEFKGSQWTYRAMPTPSGGSFPLIKGVSCTSSSNCIAVGRVLLASGAVVPVAEKWNGTNWSVQSLPAPPTKASQPYARLDDVSCASASECMAVGYFKASESGGSPTWQVHAARLKEGSWTNMFPLPPEDSDLLGISCPSTSFCAVTGVGQSLIWNGSSWSAHAQAAEARFEDVSCTSQSFCLAVSPEPYAQVWDGTQWSAIKRQPTDLYGVDCASPSHCIAAGYRYGSRIYPVVEKWDGSALSAQATVRESDRSSYFWDIECSWVSGCAAVGGSEGEGRKPLITMAPDWRPGIALDTPQIGNNDAILRGTVDPKGFATSYRFEWGPTSSYGNVVPIPDAAIGSGYSPVEVSQKIAGLKPGTTYHYRLVAESDEGTSVSEDGTFVAGSAGFGAQAFPASISGQQLLSVPTIRINGNEFNCWGLNFQTKASPPITKLAPTSLEGESCKNTAGTGTFKPNACTLEFKPVGKTEGSSFAGQLSIGPAGCGAMTFSYTYFGSKCEATFAPQTASGITYTNTGTGNSRAVEVSVPVGGVPFAYKLSGPGICGSEKGTAQFNSKWKVSAENSGVPSPLYVIEPLPMNLSLSEGSFKTEAYPALLSGSQIVGNPHTIKINGNVVTCKEIDFTGQLASASTELSVGANFNDCYIIFGLKFKATVTMNSCRYVFHSSGTADISCPKEGDAVEISVPVASCKIRIPPQTGLKGVSYGVGGNSEKGLGVTVSLNLSGFQYTVPAPQGLCGSNGTKSTYTGGSLVHAAL